MQRVAALDATPLARRWRAGALALATLLATGGTMEARGAGANAAGKAEAFEAATLQWRSERVARLQRPDGWLSLVGLHWLQPGMHRIGSAAGNDIVLATGPARLGRIELHEDKVVLHPQAGAGVLVDGSPAAGPVELLPDSSGTPTRVELPRSLAADANRQPMPGPDQAEGASVGAAVEPAGSEAPAFFTVIERSGRLGLRVRDPQAPTRTGFVGIDYFDIDPSWRISARFEPHPPGQTLEIASVINTLDPMPNPGAVVFERDGRVHRLEAVDEGDGQLFLIFADRSSGRSTYGAGRFLYAEPPLPGSTTVVVDFNRAYNPPCALNAYSTCPLPPPENRLDLEVTAGERSYRGPTH